MWPRQVTPHARLGSPSESRDESVFVVSPLRDQAVRLERRTNAAQVELRLLGVSLPERVLAAVRTYGDLAALVVDRVPCPATMAEEPVLVRARITPPGSRLGRTIVRVLVLTPYAIEMISEDAHRTGRGTRVELSIPGGSREPVLARLRATFGDLAACGIDVDVSRDGRWHAGGTVQHPR